MYLASIAAASAALPRRHSTYVPSATMLLNCALALLLLCNVLGCSAQCKDSNNGTLDRDGDGCEYYDFHTADCGLYDDNDFSAKVMCCACGGQCIDTNDGALDHSAADG